MRPHETQKKEGEKMRDETVVQISLSWKACTNLQEFIEQRIEDITLEIENFGLLKPLIKEGFQIIIQR